MKFVLALLFIFCATPVYAGYKYKEVIIASNTRSVPVHSSIDIDADYVVATLTFWSETRSAEQRTTELNAFAESLNTIAQSESGIDLQKGTISLSATEKQKSARSSRSHIILFYELNENNNVYSATQAMNTFIQKIQAPKNMTYNLGNTNLAIRNPAQYRDKLLRTIRADIDETKQSLGEQYKVSVSGLEKPVVVRQKDDKKVTLYIDYKLHFSEWPDK